MPQLKYDPIVFQEGIQFDSYCSYCQQRHNGMMFKTSFYWCIRFEHDCGREKVLGYLIPPAEIERMGRTVSNQIANSPHEQLIDDAIAQELELKARWNLDQMVSGRTRQKYI